MSDQSQFCPECQAKLVDGVCPETEFHERPEDGIIRTDDDNSADAPAALTGPDDTPPPPPASQPLDARAHLGDGDSAAREAGATPPKSAAPLFDALLFDPELALEELMRLNDRANMARSEATIKKDKYTEADKKAKTLEAEVLAMIRDIKWKKEAHDKAKREPALPLVDEANNSPLDDEVIDAQSESFTAGAV